MRFPLVPYLLVTLFSVKTSVSFCGLFVGEIFFFSKMTLLCFLGLGVQMQMSNEIISVYTASVPVILFIAIHYWKN